MDYEDDPPFRRRIQTEGVAPGWRIVAILALAAAALLLGLTFLMGVAFVQDRSENNSRVQQQPIAPPFGGFVGPAGGGLDDDDEPPNPPYPLVADLRLNRPLAVEAAQARPKPPATSRDRFRALGRELWTGPQDNGHELTLSPDGKTLAIVEQRTLKIFSLADGRGELIAGPGDDGLGQGPPAVATNPLLLEGSRGPTWSRDSHRIYLTRSDGVLCARDVRTSEMVLAFRGQSPVPIDDARLAYCLPRHAPKADLPGAPAALDPTEVFLRNYQTGDSRVLLKAGQAAWEPRAVSPDGNRLVLVARESEAGRQRLRLYVLDLTADQPQARPVGEPIDSLGGIAWADGGKVLVYGRWQITQPPDHWEMTRLGAYGPMDLFELDPETGREQRLSRGGAFDLAGVGNDGALFVVVYDTGPPPWTLRLRSIALADARTFAAQERERPLRDVAAWTKLVDRVLEEAHLPADAGGAALTPERLATLADTFGRLYKEQFQTEPPTDFAAWHRLRREVIGVGMSAPAYERHRLVVGAAEGEFLRRRHGAVWRLGEGPLTQADNGAADEGPFALAVNPFLADASRFAALDDEDDDVPPSSWAEEALVHARGRPLVLANGPNAAKTALAALADPELARGVELLRQKKSEEGERVLLALARRKEHERNECLNLHIGRQLIEHGRLATARLLLLERLGKSHDPHRYNLYGLTLLDEKPDVAAASFRDALRCDLRYGPGYLNLALAHEKLGNQHAAELCLRRYLKLCPGGRFTDDARQRLAALQAGVVEP